MTIIHITPDTDGYEIVTLLANAYSVSNKFAVIEKNGEILITGGILIHDTPEIRTILDSIDKKHQYEFISILRKTPFVKCYYDEPCWS